MNMQLKAEKEQKNYHREKKILGKFRIEDDEEWEDEVYSGAGDLGIKKKGRYRSPDVRQRP